jgi:hypothetical protein
VDNYVPNYSREGVVAEAEVWKMYVLLVCLFAW